MSVADELGELIFDSSAPCDDNLYTSVEQFYAEHMRAIDDGNIGAWVSGFTADAIFTSNSIDHPIRGRDDIGRYLAAAARDRVDQGVRHRHLVSMLRVSAPLAGRVRTRSYVLVLEQRAGEGGVSPLGWWESV